MIYSEVRHHVALQENTEIWYEHVSCLFKVDVCRVKNRYDYVGSLQEEWSLSSTGVDKEIESILDRFAPHRFIGPNRARFSPSVGFQW
jgi:hypothetical protein